MAQQHEPNEQNNSHLTTEQLSALIDQQITAEEQAAYSAHLQTCQQCQQAMAALRQTVMLLKALPQPTLPRSFVLPTNLIVMPERPATVLSRPEPARTTQPQQQRRRMWIYTVQRSMRAISTIAAVIGLIFVLSSLSISLPQFGGTSTTTASVPSTNHQNAGKAQPFGSTSITSTPKLGPNHTTPLPAHTPAAASTSGSTPAAVPTPIATPNTGPNPSSPGPSQSQPSLSIVNLQTSMGRQDVGFALLLLGIVGVVVTRRKHEKRVKA